LFEKISSDSNGDIIEMAKSYSQLGTNKNLGPKVENLGGEDIEEFLSSEMAGLVGILGEIRMWKSSNFQY
jgi:hypothetical protein